MIELTSKIYLTPKVPLPPSPSPHNGTRLAYMQTLYHIDLYAISMPNSIGLLIASLCKDHA